MAIIDLSSPESIEGLLKRLQKHLVRWRKAIKLPKTKSAKTSQKNKNLLIKKGNLWKSYMMVFDLVKTVGSCDDASNTLSEYDELYS